MLGGLVLKTVTPKGEGKRNVYLKCFELINK